MHSSFDRSNIDIGLAESADERAAAFALRMLVFVEEQLVPPEEELDAYDLTAEHFVVRIPCASGTGPAAIVGTARLVDRGCGVGKIGRVAIHADFRGLGLGAQLMRVMHAYANSRGYRRLILEAQCYAIPFYEKFGYVADGEVFLDANIEHRHMSLGLDAQGIAGENPCVQVPHPALPVEEY